MEGEAVGIAVNVDETSIAGEGSRGLRGDGI